MRVDSSSVAFLLNGAYGQHSLRVARAGQQEEKDDLIAKARKKAVGDEQQPEEMKPRAVVGQEKEMIYSQAIRMATGSGSVGMAFSSATDRGNQANDMVPLSRNAGMAESNEPDETALRDVDGEKPAEEMADSRKKEDAENDPAVSTEIAQLKQRAQEVIAHEAAHKAVGGQYASAASYTYTTGPDGKKYISGGEVSIHTPATNDPKEALKIAETVRQAALAPANPSGQDLSVAASASQDAAVARAEMARTEITEKQGREEPVAGEKDAADSSLQGSNEKTDNSLTTRENRQTNRSALPEEPIAISSYGTRKAAAAYSSQLLAFGHRQPFHAIG